MADNSKKIPFADSLRRFTQQATADDAQSVGLALPCEVTAVDGAIVTVKFLIMSIPGFPQFTLPQVQCPIAESIYVRLPVQVGDLGMVISATANLNGVSGLGGGTADLSQPANLAALSFVPLGNANWDAPDDPNKLELAGKSGVIIRSKLGGTIKIDIDDASGNITVTVPGGGDLVVNGISFLTHVHSGVTTGGSDTGPPV